MLFNKFNETNEAKENTDNKEVSTEKNEKRRNQILEGADDFKSKIEKSEGKEEENSKETKNKSDGSEKTGLFKDIKIIFSKNKVEKTDKTIRLKIPMLQKWIAKKNLGTHLRLMLIRKKGGTGKKDRDK